MIKFNNRSKCICEFCKEKFTPRAQVKNPRACNKRSCQRKRQKINEKEWRERNKGLYDKKYHNIMKQKRKERLLEYSGKLLELIEIGRIYLDEKLKIENISEYIFNFFIKLGIRKVKKFWIQDNPLLEGLSRQMFYLKKTKEFRDKNLKMNKLAP